MQKNIKRNFADIATYSATEHTAVSIRDGVIEYLGSELNLSPADKIFTVYRSPATIANAAQLMPGIALTDEHIDMNTSPPATGSTVIDSQVIDQLDATTQTLLAVKNKLLISDAMSAMLADKKELSLGYSAELSSHDVWDFEQTNIVPHHLAAVAAGRCGSLCRFLDKKLINTTKSKTMPKINAAFLDADGDVSLEQIVIMATELPDAIKKVPLDRLPEIMPALQEIMSYAKEQGVIEVEDESAEIDTVEATDEATDEQKPKFSDADFKKALAKEKASFADAAVKRYSEIVNKAKNFLDEGYDFAGKTSAHVMRDALATQSAETFKDEELDVAFKMLRKSDADYSRFGDSKAEGALSARINKQLRKV
ncbi:MAG: DUF2213 domain-containing protein [Methyloprofundus sp.]|nr:DUF2213 domain-containing protein [Methyloprofundus sp.]